MPAAIGVLLVSLLAIGPREHAQRIDWEAVDNCPSQPAVEQATVAYLGRPLADYEHALVAVGRVEPSVSGYQLRLTIDVDGVAERHELGALDCEQLGRDAALLIASAVDPFTFGPPLDAPAARQLLVVSTRVVVQRPRSRSVAATGPEPPKPSPSPEPSRPPEDWELTIDAPTLDAPRRARARRPSPTLGTLGIAGTGFAGLFPRVGGGLELEGGLQRGLFRWQLGASGWFGGSFRAPQTDVGGDLWALSGTTGGCVVPRVERVEFPVCGVVGAGVIVATAVNTTAPASLPRPWVYAGLDLRAVWHPRPRLGLYLGLSVLPALARPAWAVSSPDASFRIAPVAGLLRLGVALGGLEHRPV
ncbi:hypothetical protein [Enhygromyxa salina]|uniref:Uncharacterized protein n=1 Tax=Enhygromyxa salina TaxID=215803 RepID=A0A2S9XT96_9BACT|nr:hypothetical protein [Enhygromyxa salina]PRP96064.1 hypothetical protein ENSA7_68780 [Enhygromyxa salina]